MKASIVVNQPLAFQQTAFQWLNPTDAFQRDAFQETSWQEDPHSGGFQDSSFQDGSFQVTEDAFQENAWQPAGAEPLKSFQEEAFQPSAAWQEDPHKSAFQIELEPPVAAAVVSGAPKLSIYVSENRRAALVARTRRHRAIILRAPQAAPVVVVASPKLSIYVTRERRAARVARLRRHKVLLRAPLAPLVPKRAVVKTRTLERTRIVARLRKRKPQILHSLVAAQPSRGRVQLHEKARPARGRIRWRSRPILLRAPSTPTAAPATGIPVKRIFVYEDRRPTLVRMRRRARIILRAPSVQTPVPLVRQHVTVSKRSRTPLMAKQRHRSKPIMLRAALAPVRAPRILVKRQRRRIEKKRKRAILVRSVPIWQRSGHPLVVGKPSRPRLWARARRRSRILGSRVFGPPPPPSTASGFGLVFLSDNPVYEGSVLDLSVFQAALGDRPLYDLITSDGDLSSAYGDGIYGSGPFGSSVKWTVGTSDRPMAGVGVDDIPGR